MSDIMRNVCPIKVLKFELNLSTLHLLHTHNSTFNAIYFFTFIFTSLRAFKWDITRLQSTRMHEIPGI